MSAGWKITMKSGFTAELLALPARDMHQVMEKIGMLEQDPRPDSKTKKQLKHIDHRLHRIRCGDYRVFYTFDRSFVSLLALRRRREDTYDGNQHIESLGGFDPDLTVDDNLITSTLPNIRKEPWVEPAQQMLPRPVTGELLNKLQIPTRYHAVLLTIQSAEDLWDCPDVPEHWITLLLEHLTSPLPDLGETYYHAPTDPVSRFLPKPITGELLNDLRIPIEYRAVLLTIRCEDELLNCTSVPSQFLTPLIEYQYPAPLHEVMQQRDLVLHELEDLQRFKQGELLGFLLQLSREQEMYVQKGLHAHGPTLLKGGPGTGKSTIALHRVHALVREFRQQGRKDFHVLFATYTEPLMSSSEQLLRQLLGQDSSYVDVKTTDALALSILKEVNAATRPASEEDIQHCLQQAIHMTQFDGTSQQQQAQLQTIERLSQKYLEQEINQVIIARQLASFQEYLSAARHGRKVSLNTTQRMAVWSVYKTYKMLLEAWGGTTWPLLRVQAERCVAQGRVNLRYDAVIIDEAQDLDVSALRMLIQLCANPHRLFVTADANQAIYGSGFNWSDVYASLRFQGRTAVLRTNYRSTRQIGEAARSYLGDGGLEQDADGQGYAYSGTRPLVRAFATSTHEIELLEHFLTTSAHELHLSLSSCAVLCPNRTAGEAITRRLTHMGLQSTFMGPTEVDLGRPGIKVMRLRSAKGLEFPVVAIAGFLNVGSYTANDDDRQDTDRLNERDEALALDRRSIYVGMTRAMRALLVAIPDNTRFPLLTGFNPVYWDMS